LLSTLEYANQHGISQRTVQRWIKSGELYAEKHGNRYLIPDDEPTTVNPLPQLDEPSPYGRAESKFVTTKEYAASLGVNVRKIRAMIKSGEIDAIKEGRRYLIEIAIVPEPSPFAPEQVDDSEDDGFPTTDTSRFDTMDLRSQFVTLEDAEFYKEPIPVPSFIIKNEEGLFQVIINYPDPLLGGDLKYPEFGEN
jgi:excisionase family DNA binding protein